QGAVRAGARRAQQARRAVPRSAGVGYPEQRALEARLGQQPGADARRRLERAEGLRVERVRCAARLRALPEVGRAAAAGAGGPAGAGGLHAAQQRRAAQGRAAQAGAAADRAVRAAAEVTSGRLRLATWNVNSLKVRLPHLLDWLAQAAPDVVCLQ